MRISQKFILRLRSLFRRGHVEAELGEELRYHIERQIEQNLASGMTPAEARRVALLEFGGVEQMKEQCRDSRGVAFIEGLIQDLRYGLRTLSKSRGYTTVAVLSLTLGIGANTVMFSLLDQALLQPLPVEEPEELVVFRSPGPVPGMNRNSGEMMSFSYPIYVDFRDQSDVFLGVAARFQVEANLMQKTISERVTAELVSGNYFEVLGVRSAAGRLLSPEDDRKLMGHPVVVLSHEYWLRSFGGDPSIVGDSVILNDCAMTVIGISSADFHGVESGMAIDVYIPMMMKPALTPTWATLGDLQQAWLNIIARVNPGLNREQAEAGINVLYKQVLREEAKALQGSYAAMREEFLARHLELLPLATGIRWWTADNIATTVVPLTCMVALVLLIACVNLAGLLLARTATRQQEFFHPPGPGSWTWPYCAAASSGESPARIRRRRPGCSTGHSSRQASRGDAVPGKCGPSLPHDT